MASNKPAPEIVQPTDEIPDQDLVASARAGDAAAFRTLVEKYQRRVYGLALGIVKDPDEAMDVAQDAFVKVHRYLPEFQGESSFYTWVYRITVNLSIDARRKRAARREESNDDEESMDDLEAPPEALGVDPGKELQRSEIRERIGEALEQLPEKHRTILLLREIEGLSYEELARVLGIRKGTVMSRLFHARLKMQKILKEYVEK